MTQAEIWRDIPGFEGFYQASSLGRVRSIDRTITTSNGRQWVQPGKSLTPDTNHNGGYLTVQLSRNGIAKRYLVHRLIASAFLPNPTGLPEVNHKNGLKHQNDTGNLEWADRQRNIDHAVEHTLIDNKGEKNQQAKLTENEVLEIRRLSASGLSNSEIAAVTRATRRNVQNITSRTSWKHVAVAES